MKEKGRDGYVATLNLQRYHTIGILSFIHSSASKQYLFPCSGVLYQNRSFNSIGVKAAAEARWSRIMEERRRRATEYSITVDKERGQVALSMPH